MKINLYIERLLCFLLLSAVSGNFFSCTHDELFPGTDPDKTVTEGYMKIYLKVPVNAIPLRAISGAHESAIGNDGLYVMVFKVEADNSEVFDYIAPITERTGNNLTVKLVRSQDAVKYRIVIVANSAVPMPVSEGKTKEDVLKEIIFENHGKWNAASSDDFTPFPMWGEIDEPIEVKENTPEQTIRLLRAIARVDIGLNFEDTPETFESVLGLANFKLKSVRVYRTLDKGHMAPDKAVYSNGSVTAPTIPADATPNADTAPLVYELTTAADSYIREIYLPEANKGTDMDNAPCIVIGGYYGAGNTTDVSYYRIDFAVYDNDGKILNYLDILRNHRYRMNVKDVTGPGFTNPEDALNSIPSNIVTNVIPWDESILEMHVEGKYYFGIDRREVTLSHTAGSAGAITFETNLPAEDVAIQWENTSQAHFMADLDYNNKVINVTANNINDTQAYLEEYFSIQAGSFTIRVKVVQNFLRGNFYIDCNSVKVNGVYTDNLTLNAGHTITLTLVSADKSVFGYDYELSTNTVDGISFSGTGTITALRQQVTLQGAGTVNNQNPKALTISANNYDQTTCQTRIQPAFSAKNILCLGTVNNHGYYLEGGSSRGMMEAAANFGLLENSIVKVEEIYYTALSSSNTSTLTTAINAKPDIVVIGYNYTLDAGRAAILFQYLQDGGIVFAFIENDSPLNLFSLVFPGAGITYVLRNQGGAAYALADIDDPLTHGPFGDYRGKAWGEDYSATTTYAGIPADKVYAYTYANRVGATTSYTELTLFRHREYNLVFAGDGGFLANSGDIKGDRTNTNAYPFGVDESYNPVPNTGYGTGVYATTVYNSHIFGNFMAWAFEEAEYRGINTN
ncbi:MAG TPA: hypothetical protein DEG28_01950 [Porphyromonadaceae bacterium]|nr:hypothetical protein [Porphyromonadaceae bacterium]